MTPLTLPSGKYLLVTVPEDALDIEVIPDKVDASWPDYLKFVSLKEDMCAHWRLPPGRWQLIGKGGELSEEQWKGIVETEYIEDIGHFPIDYETEESDCSSYTESGLSLLRSHGMNENTIILKEKV